MRWTRSLIPTLREDPADAEAISHKLMVRAGLVRQLAAGIYVYLPLGQRVIDKVNAIIREEMNAIGGQEITMPVLHPAEIWKQSGRWDVIGGEMFRLKDRNQRDMCLGMTHEEVVAWLAAREIRSYRELPQIWYQIQTKFRDEPRPKSGLLRVREFTMKDSYSFDIDQAGLDRQFDNHYAAYTRIFRRTGLEPIPVQASSGVMGGSESVEFMMPSEAGEDFIAVCRACGYAGNVERATAVPAPVEDAPWDGPPERLPTPGVRTIAALEAYGDFAAAGRQIKTMVYVIGGRLTLVLLRGDHEVMEQKLIDGLGTTDIRPGHPDEIHEALGAMPGSLGAVGVKALPIIADPSLQGRRNMVTGANEDDWHLRGVDVGRDIAVGRWLDVRRVNAGEGCPQCAAPLEVFKAIEVGHIFKLGTKYSDALGARVLDEEGQERAIVMGSYGIGLGRQMAAVVEAHHDEAGIVWPVSVAPFEAVVTPVAGDAVTTAAAEDIYRELLERGIETLIDDRDERPGVKFADAELIGIPYRVTVGPRRLAEGKVEVVRRRGRATEMAAPGEAAAIVAAAVTAER